MDIVRRRCAGIVIGTRSLMACLITTDARGNLAKEIRTFGTLTSELLALRSSFDPTPREPGRVIDEAASPATDVVLARGGALGDHSPQRSCRPARGRSRTARRLN